MSILTFDTYWGVIQSFFSIWKSETEIRSYMYVQDVPTCHLIKFVSGSCLFLINAAELNKESSFVARTSVYVRKFVFGGRENDFLLLSPK